MVKNSKEQTADEIQILTDQRVKEILECEPETTKKEFFYMKLNQAKLGMVYIRDREIMKRINSGQMIRVINFITSDEKERKAYIQASMPELTPMLEK